MTQDETEILVARLEKFAEREPLAYKTRVFLLALLGYGYLGLVVRPLATAGGDMRRLQRIDNTVNALITPRQVRKDFLAHEQLVTTLYNAVRPDTCVVELTPEARARNNTTPSASPEALPGEDFRAFCTTRSSGRIA